MLNKYITEFLSKEASTQGWINTDTNMPLVSTGAY